MPRRIEMTSNRLPFRVAALTGVAAFLCSFAHVSPAAAQTPTRYVKTCSADLPAGAAWAECVVSIPDGKRFVIETVTVGGYVPSAQYTKVDIATEFDSHQFKYAIPAGFQVLSNGWSWWGGALTSTIVGEEWVKLNVYRQGAGNAHSLRLTVAGYLEDM
jgi:hypothetical protein